LLIIYLYFSFFLLLNNLFNLFKFFRAICEVLLSNLIHFFRTVVNYILLFYNFFNFSLNN